ncbi:uncharacterized protein LOC141567935 [Rhinolophus sinicus]|uniref:uncharacterized protein LOC141567935 n=1 Tax=Rhinolophus sinicus TaxID=89399 RepID=UPI003D79B073
MGPSMAPAHFQVVNRLGLDSLSPFNPKERIIEYLVPDDGPEQSLVDKPLCAFVREVGARSAAPGGGSVAAASAAMDASLACMAGLMTYGRRQFEHLDATMRRLIPPFHKAAAQLMAMVHRANAFTLFTLPPPRPPPRQLSRNRGPAPRPAQSPGVCRQPCRQSGARFLPSRMRTHGGTARAELRSCRPPIGAMTLQSAARGGLGPLYGWSILKGRGTAPSAQASPRRSCSRSPAPWPVSGTGLRCGGQLASHPVCVPDRSHPPLRG